ncbi:MAG: YafY family protein [Micropruina sp.]|uniref:helix-turn-helix transcriptional regulator n=1 Tax=Micropruina sp. TaxID=2737536 RepID=UPI0039E30A70
MSTDTTERALRVLGLLQSRPGWTASELARDLGVTTRTVRRDVDRLRQLGYAIEADRGAAGGYWLSRGRAVPPLLFTEDEAVAVGVGLQRTAALGIGADAESAVGALVKLDAALPGPLRDRLRDLRSVVSHTGGIAAPTSPELLTRIAAAIRARVRLRFGYPPTRSPDLLERRRVEPYRLVAADRGWYLSAFDLDRDDWRLFRLDRMTEVAASTLGYRPRPEPPDPVERLGRRPVDSYPFFLVVRIETSLAQAIEWFGAHGAQLTAIDDHTTELRSGVQRPEYVSSWLADLPVPYRVLGDDDVRAAFAASVERMQAAL